MIGALALADANPALPCRPYLKFEAGIYGTATGFHERDIVLINPYFSTGTNAPNGLTAFTAS